MPPVFTITLPVLRCAIWLYPIFDYVEGFDILRSFGLSPVVEKDDPLPRLLIRSIVKFLAIDDLENYILVSRINFEQFCGFLIS